MDVGDDYKWDEQYGENHASCEDVHPQDVCSVVDDEYLHVAVQDDWEYHCLEHVAECDEHTNTYFL